jgi:hypothetical protein
MDSNEDKVTETGMPNPRFDGRARTSATNGKRGGRRRIRIDHREWERLFLGGTLNRDTARQLGVSVRTLQRRKADRQRQDPPM